MYSSNLLDALPKLPNPFKALEAPDAVLSQFSLSGDSDEFESSSSGLIQQAKRVISSDLGLQDPSLLDDDKFVWIGPQVDRPLGKRDYIAAGKFFDLRACFPDLDYRAHDFRVDEDDETTVRLTCRATGTMRGELRLRNKVCPPSGQKMICPPEAITITFDPDTGKVVKLCTGFALDRLVGNTAGLTGAMAAATIAGEDISDWEVYPPTAVVQRFFGRPVRQLPETKAFLAPFPETVMIQLAKGILAADMAADDPTLLSDKFTYCTPYVGPVRKNEFLEKYAREEFSGFDPSFSYFRVDPYDPVRVWVDVKPSAPGYDGAPQAMSFTFDDEGYCTRITSGAVIDPSAGNGGGLGAAEGYKYAMGQASPGITTRPLPRILGRLKNRLLEPFTKIGADDYVLPGAEQSRRKPKPPRTSPLEKLSSLRADASPVLKAKQAQVDDAVAAQKADAERRRKEAETRKAAAAAAAAAAKAKKANAQQALPTKSKPAVAPPKFNLPPTPKLDIPKIDLPNVPLSPAKKEQPAAKIEKVNGSIFNEVSLKSFVQTPSKPAPTTDTSKQTAALERQRQAEKRRKQAEQARLEEEQKRRELAEQRKREVEAQRVAADQARQREIEAKRAAAEAAQRQKQEEADRRRQEAQERQAAIVAEKQRKIEEQKAATERQRQEALERQKQLEAKKAEDERRRKEAEEARRLQIEAQKAEKEALAEERRLQQVAQAEQKKKELEARKKAQEEEKQKKADQARREQEAKAGAAAAIQAAKERRERAEAALESLKNAASRATIGLFKLGAKPEGDYGSLPVEKPTPASKKTAPAGVPTLTRWRKNADGTLTGVIRGSNAFKDGERITTSRIASGSLSSGEVVRTGSGSRYFLS